MMNRYEAAALCVLLVGTHYTVYQAGKRAERLSSVEATNATLAGMDVLQRTLAHRDKQLAESQARDADVRTKTITKREVVYRDRIKTVTVRDCVSDSGLFELYNATLGTDAGKR